MVMTLGLVAANRPAAAPAVETVSVNVPFVFVAGNQSLPAGTYRVQLLTQSNAGRDAVEVVVFRGAEAHSYVSFVAKVEGGGNSGTPSLTFRQQGGRAVLTEVQVRGTRFTLLKPKAQTEVAPEAADNNYVTLVVEGLAPGDPLGQR